ncbi:MAG: hypothetical protein KYX68_01945 [Flavobacterium sp.]|nr:hypothetical protein [Flavobacterium sp.]
MKNITLSMFMLFGLACFAQVGVGTTTPNGALDVSSSTNGLIPPRVALTATNVAAPVVNPQGGALVPGTLVWNTNTAGAIPTNVAPGMYYWDGTRWVSLAGSPGGLDWSIIGNGGIDGGVTGITGTPATQGTHFIGTYDNTNFDIRTSGLHAARVSSLGEFFIGGLETVLPGDLMNGISEGNPAFPWAINGYTDQNGAGVYGRVSGGNTNFGAIQGEYEGTGTRGTAVRGILGSTLGGTATNDFPSAINGDLFFNGGTYSAQDYSFAVAGNTFANSGRVVGGVYGLNFRNNTYGILGYERSNGNNVSVLGNSTYTNNTFRTSQNTGGINTSVGLAIDGGFLGGHLKGNQLGLISKGEIAGLYSDGNTISTKGYTVVDKDENGNKSVSYVPTSTTVDFSTKGTGKLSNGETFISFDKNYSNTIDAKKPIIVTVSPMGESKGVYVSRVSKDGFYVKENGNGVSNVDFYWIAIGEKINANDLNVPTEMLAKDFDEKLDSFLTINEDAKGGDVSEAMWWNGSSLEFGKSAPNEIGEADDAKLKEIGSNERPKGEIKPKKENLRASQIKEIVKEQKSN